MPDNVIVCATRGAGITSLSGGDLDGDILFCTQNKALVRYVESTEMAMEDVPWDATAEAKEAVGEQDRTAWKHQTVEEYLAHMADVPTLNVRGTATWIVEVLQDIFSHTC